MEAIDSEIDGMIIAIEANTAMYVVHKEWFKATLLNAKNIKKLFDKVFFV